MALVLRMSEDFATMTFAEALAFIERSRRQLEGLKRLRPNEAAKIDWDEIASIHVVIDALENRIRSHPSCPA